MGEVGRVGVAIDSLEDMEVLLDGIPLERVSTSMTINCHGLDPARALHRGRAPARDPRGRALGDGAERHPEGVRRARDLDLPARRPRCGWSPTSSPIARSACRAGTRSPSPGTTSARRGRRRRRRSPSPSPTRWSTCAPRAAAGLDAEKFGERISFFFACHSDFIEEVAKFRAARRLWARLVKETFGIANPRAQHLRFHVQTGGVTLTAQQPDNNVVRVALQALAAVLGGCQSLHTNGKDEALALPTEAVGPARPAHAAGHRARVRRGRHRRPAGRVVGGGGGHRDPRARGAGDSSSASSPGAARWPPSSAATSSARSRSPPTATSGRSSPASA